MVDYNAPFNVLHSYVYEGVWEKYGQGPFNRWIWTVKDNKAILGLTVVTILIAVAQQRAWIILRYLIYQRTKSPELSGTTISDYRKRLSQGRAVSEVIHFVRYSLNRLSRHSASSSDAPDSPTSPWFGILALLNVSLFVAMSVLVPWLLTDGSLETPIVKSRVTDDCLTAYRWENVLKIIQDLPRTDAILQQCLNKLNDTCTSQYYLRQPDVRRERIDSCPFPKDICFNGTKPVEMTHWNISAYEIGVNSPAKLTMNHRLVCSPVYLDPFYLFRYKNTTPITLTEAFITVRSDHILFGNFTLALRTLNGPNFASNNNSGVRMAEENGPFQLVVLPRYFAGSDASSNIFHPDLRRADAMPFLIIYRAGPAMDYSPVDDPVFSAHSQRRDDNSTYYADHEATAMACAEQFQFCLMGSQTCSQWGRNSRGVYELARHPQLKDDEVSLAEILILLRVMPSMFSVYNYLAMRIDFHGMVPLTRAIHPSFDFRPGEKWVNEVEVWFMKAIVEAILYARNGVRFPLVSDSEEFDASLRRKYALCGRILFRDEAYTNVNWVGLWFTIGLLILICFASMVIEMIYHAVKELPGIARRASAAFPFFWTIAVNGVTWLWGDLLRTWTPPRAFMDSALLSEPRGRQTATQATMPTELDDLGHPSSIQPLAQEAVPDEYVAIDNPV